MHSLETLGAALVSSLPFPFEPCRRFSSWKVLRGAGFSCQLAESDQRRLQECCRTCFPHRRRFTLAGLLLYYDGPLRRICSCLTPYCPMKGLAQNQCFKVVFNSTFLFLRSGSAVSLVSWTARIPSAVGMDLDYFFTGPSPTSVLLPSFSVLRNQTLGPHYASSGSLGLCVVVRCGTMSILPFPWMLVDTVNSNIFPGCRMVYLVYQVTHLEGNTAVSGGHACGTGIGESSTILQRTTRSRSSRRSERPLALMGREEMRWLRSYVAFS